MNRKLGKLSVNPMGFGGIPIQRIPMEEAITVLNAVLDNGINFIDTARVYTDSEEKIGNAISHRRKEFYIATKGLVSTKQDMEEQIRISQNKLKTEYIDLYQVHNVGDETRFQIVMGIDGATKALEEAKEAGVIGMVGITGHKVDFLLKLIDTGRFDTVQFPFNVLELDKLKVLEKANELGMGTIIMKPLAGGAFKNADLALKFILEYNVSVIIPGMDSVQQVIDNVNVMKNPKLTDEERKILDKEAKSIEKNLCRRCDYCQPCPKGIPIAGVLMFHSYFDRYGMHKWARERYAGFVTKANACEECGICETRCPYDLPIRKMLKKAHKDMS